MRRLRDSRASPWVEPGESAAVVISDPDGVVPNRERRRLDVKLNRRDRVRGRVELEQRVVCRAPSGWQACRAGASCGSIPLPTRSDRSRYLVTTWLTPGKHRFSVRVTETKGTKAVDTVTARVLPAPQPPAALAGAWTRVVTAQDVQKAQPQYGSPPPVGTWKLVFDRVGAWELTPMQTGEVDEYDAEAGIIHAYAPIQMAPFSCNQGTCHGGVSRFGYHPIGGNNCTWSGPFGTYQWTVSGTTLTLTAIHEACGNR